MHHKETKPTDGEMEILQVLWSKKKATVRDVYEIISEKKECGYTTTLKLMQIMFDKKLVKRNESAKTHIYEARISKESMQKNLIDRMVDNVFQGSATGLVLQALGSAKPSSEELSKIQELLDKLKEDNY